MKWIKRLCSFLFLCIVIASGILCVKGYMDYREALDQKSVEEMAYEIESIENYTTIDQLPETYIDAVLAVEDKRFYSHPGIDPIAIGRAFVNDIRAGAYVEGGSTITQQLAKNQYFTQDKKIVRKIAEMFMAFKIESVLDKDKIFELYVNSIFFGNGYYCVYDAAQGYFGKVPYDMNFDECTILAGVPNAPTNYNPVASPELARERQAQVIEKMERAGYLDTSAGIQQ
ncbi:MAG TPA: transglycosylase domain-containing protein [Candidatus Mediterraneibacter vanvlietii]|nr:transglycosylase domain-containing protein [Candidatus Mediterraneibacter vanvlietii]